MATMFHFFTQQEHDAIIACMSHMQQIRENSESLPERRGAANILPRDVHLKLIDKVGDLYRGESDVRIIRKRDAGIIYKAIIVGLNSLEGEELNTIARITDELKRFSES